MRSSLISDEWSSVRMRLGLDDDVLDAECDFTRESVRSTSITPGAQRQRSGLPLLQIQDTGAVVDLQLVNQLQDELS